jgi:hypothetical protein
MSAIGKTIQIKELMNYSNREIEKLIIIYSRLLLMLQQFGKLD